MRGIENYRPVSVPPETIELRIHGVSGTPPENLVKDTTVLVAGTASAGFHRHDAATVNAAPPPDAPGVIEGYAWGGLTSGTRIASALRLLLLPFALVNVAGWMLPGGRDPDDGDPTAPEVTRRVRVQATAHTLMSRLLALALTAYATTGVYWVATVVTERMQRRGEWFNVPDDSTRAALCLACVVAATMAWAIIGRRTARSPDPATLTARPGAAAEPMRMAMRSPAAAPQEGLGVSLLWAQGHVTSYMSRAHVLAGTGCALLLFGAEADASGSLAVLARVGAWGLAAAGLVAIVLLALGRVPGASRAWLRWAITWVAVVAAVTVAALARHGVPARRDRLSDVAEVYDTTLLLIAGAVCALLLAQVVVGNWSGRFAGKWYAGAFTVIAFGTAITGVAGGTVALNQRLATADHPAPTSPISQTVAVIGLVAIVVAVAAAIMQWRVTQGVGGVAWFQRFRGTIANARGIIVLGATTFALGAVAVAVDRRWLGALDTPVDTAPGAVGWASLGWVAVAALIAAIPASYARGTVLRGLALLAATVTVLVAAVAAATVARVVLKGADSATVEAVIAESDSAFAAIAIVGALLAPLAAVGLFIVRTSREEGARRMVGVLWDLVSFWPRHFHPWAPAPYTDTTIPQLTERVRHLADHSGASTVIVSAHSQGAVIAVPMLQKLKEDGYRPDGARIALLTYGQLLDVHYRWLFPWVFNPQLFREVDEYLTHAGKPHWINLRRSTDPLGHAVRILPDGERDRTNDGGIQLNIGPTSKLKTLNHGDYWYGDAYQPALDDLARRASATPVRKLRWPRRGES